MSVYSTPVKSCFDEGSSPSSINSFYFTPRTTFSHTPQRSSRVRASKWKGKIPKFEIYNEELSQSDINLQKHELSFHKSSSSAKGHVYSEYNDFSSPAKETLIDKENYAARFSSTPSLSRGEKFHVCSPLKNISNSCIDEKSSAVLETRISNFSKHPPDLRITTANSDDELKKEQADSTVCSISSKENLSDKFKRSTLFRDIGRKFKRKKTTGSKKKVQMTPTITQRENYISDDSEKSQSFEPNSNDVEDDGSNIKQISLDSLCIISQSTDNSAVPLIETKAVGKSKRWSFVKIAKVRMSPVKRLLSKSTKYVISLKQSLLKKLSMQPIRNLFDRRKIDSDENKMETSCSSLIQNNVCSLCITNLANKDEMVSQALSSLLSKLSTMEEELKDIKNMIKSGVHTNALRSLPPPPPPPPPPPNFLNPSGTLKRKADLTTPENSDHPVKRPAIKSGVKTHFAITVEDIRSVKLRKTPATLTKRESKNLNDDNFRSLRMKKSRRSGFSDIKRSVTLAELSNRENVSLSRKPIAEYRSPKKGNVSSTIYNETPVASKNGLSGGRSHKRKELLIESPVRKRFNDGNNSSIHCDNESE